MKTTLREIIEREELDPEVRRDNRQQVGDNWEQFFAHGELDKPIERSFSGKKVDWWKAGNVVLVDNSYQSILVVV